MTVTDDNGCSNSLALNVANESAPTATATATDSNCGGNNGTATVAATGGTGDNTFVWSTTPPQNTATATDLPPGTYSITVTDAAGCVAIAVAVVNGIIADPVIQCGTATDNSATFVWEAVAGAEGYALAVNGVPTDTLAADVLTYTANGLGVSENVLVGITALSSNCGNSATVTQICGTNGCPSLVLELSVAQSVCANSAPLPILSTPALPVLAYTQSIIPIPTPQPIAYIAIH